MVLPLGDLEKTRITPFATYTLIALNVVMYLIQLDLGEPFTISYAATPYEISHNRDLSEPVLRRSLDDEGRVRVAVVDQAPVSLPVWLTIFTAMFLHGSPLHLAGNMLYLWIFGDNVEEVLGTLGYVVFYLACGLAGTLAQIIANPDSLIPTLGASGAIAGVMGAYVVWFPHNRVRVLFIRIVIQVHAVIVVGGWILIQIWEGLGAFGQSEHGGGVAYLAHVGGAVTGLVVAWIFLDRARHIHAMNEARSGWYEDTSDRSNP